MDILTLQSQTATLAAWREHVDESKKGLAKAAQNAATATTKWQEFAASTQDAQSLVDTGNAVGAYLFTTEASSLDAVAQLVSLFAQGTGQTTSALLEKISSRLG